MGLPNKRNIWIHFVNEEIEIAFITYDVIVVVGIYFTNNRMEEAALDELHDCLTCEVEVCVHTENLRLFLEKGGGNNVHHVCALSGLGGFPSSVVYLLYHGSGMMSS